MQIDLDHGLAQIKDLTQKQAENIQKFTEQSTNYELQLDEL